MGFSENAIQRKIEEYLKPRFKAHKALRPLTIPCRRIVVRAKTIVERKTKVFQAREKELKELNQAAFCDGYADCSHCPMYDKCPNEGCEER